MINPGAGPRGRSRTACLDENREALTHCGVMAVHQMPPFLRLPPLNLRPALWCCPVTVRIIVPAMQVRCASCRGLCGSTGVQGGLRRGARGTALL